MEKTNIIEDYKTVYDTIFVYVINTRDGGGWDQELAVIDHDIKKTIDNYRKSLGYGYRIEYNGPGKTHSIKDEKKGYTQLSLFDSLQEKIVRLGNKWQVQSEKGKNIGTYDTKEEAEERLRQVHYFKYKNEDLIEDTRNTLISKSKNVDPYKNTKFGKNRWERKKLSKVASAVKSYNQINMNEFFKQDSLTVNIPVTGETDTYTVSIQMPGVVTEIAKNIKSNNNKLEFRTIIQALTKVFNTQNIKVNCTCKDFLYHYKHNLIINNNDTEGTDKDPGPGKTGITALMKGQGCKHILLVLNNGDWLMKVASVIKNYIFYAEENMKAAFDKLIFPKLYGIAQNEAISKDLVSEDVNLESEKHIIEKINDWAANRGKYKPGTNKNPAAGKGEMNKQENK